MGRHHAGVHLVVAHRPHPGGVASVGEGVVHARRGSAQRAVEEQLDRVDPPTGGRVVQRRDGAELGHRLELRCDEDGLHVEGDAFYQHRPAHRLQLAGRSRRSFRCGLTDGTDGGDALTDQPLRPPVHPVGEGLDRDLRHHVEQRGHRGLADESGRAAVAATDHVAAGRVASRPVEPHRGERSGRAHGVVPIAPDQDHRPAGRHGLELVGGGQASFGEQLVVQLEAHHHVIRPGGTLAGRVGHGVEHVAQARDAVEAQVLLEHAHDQGVEVGVDEPRHEGAAGEIDHHGVGGRRIGGGWRGGGGSAGGLRHVGVGVAAQCGAALVLGADRHDAISDHGERVVPRRCRVGREDPGPPEEARRRVGAHGTTVVVHGPSPGPNGGVASSRAVMPCTPPDRPPGGRRARSGRP